MFRITTVNTFDVVKARAALEAQGQRYVAAALAFFEDRARANCPVDTGKLKASIGIVGNSVVAPPEYAIYIEWGHHNARSGRFIPPNPFFRMARAATLAAFPGVKIFVSARAIESGRHREGRASAEAGRPKDGRDVSREDVRQL